MDETHVSDIELAIDAADHELGLPKLLVVWNVVVSSLTLSDLEHGSIAINLDLNVLELLGIDLVESKDKLLIWNGERFDVLDLSLKIALR